MRECLDWDFPPNRKLKQVGTKGTPDREVSKPVRTLLPKRIARGAPKHTTETRGGLLCDQLLINWAFLPPSLPTCGGSPAMNKV